MTELLAGSFGLPAVSCTDLATGRTTVTVYFQAKPDWSLATRAGLSAGLDRISRCGLDVGARKVELRKVRPEDWAKSWKRHFRPIEIGPKLLIRPSWSRHRARRGQAVVVLDPGLSFGTGQHPTTGFCLKQLAGRRRAGAAQSFLDIGTGSGVLAIAAAKLGYAPIEAFDFDPEAVRTARAHAQRNHVLARIRFRQQDLTKLPCQNDKQYSVICANLVANLLVEEQKRILARLAKGGLLVLAGILKTEFRRVEKAYEHEGLALLAARTEAEWRSGIFLKDF